MKKKRGQSDLNIDGSEESSESGNKSNFSINLCSHFKHATDYNCILKVTKKNSFLDKCSDCIKNNEVTNDNEDENQDSPPLWICLKCMHIACGRTQNRHAQLHCSTPRSDLHCIVIDTIQWHCWCYKCDEYIVDDMLSPANLKTFGNIKNHLKKWSSSSTLVSETPNDAPVYQNKILSTDSEKKKILANLPKIGGLTNLGNTCFFNSVLQCLAQTPYLINVLDDLQISGQNFELPGGKCKGTDEEEMELPPIRGVLEKSDTPITSALRKTLFEMQNSNGNIHRPIELLNSLRKKTWQCTDGGQHDSHELLRTLLEQVRSEDIKGYKQVILEQLGLSKKTNPQEVDEDLKSRVKFYGNQASSKFLGPERVFRGELISTITCLDCYNISTRTEPFLDLSLPVCADKSLIVLKRKNSGSENSFDTSRNVSNSPSKYELKKAQKIENKKKKRTIRQKNRENGNLNNSNVNFLSEEKKGNNESEESDADIEDNVENEDTSKTELNESKNLSVHSVLNSPSNVLLKDNDKSCLEDNRNFDLSQSSNEDNINRNFTPSPTDVLMKDLTEIKENTQEKLSSLTSIAHPTITSYKGSMLSHSYSSTSNKDNNDEESVRKNSNFESSEKRDSSDKDEPLTKSNSNASDESSSLTKENSTEKLIANGDNDLLSNFSKLQMSSPFDSPSRYPTTEGECSVQQCLNQFTAKELMNGNNKVGCTKCTEKANNGKKGKMVCTESYKQYLISKAPAVLILHLKRFQAGRFSFNKVKKHVSFSTLLDLAPVSKDYRKPAVYALYGVVVHSGTLYGGHYIAYVKSRAPLKSTDPRWSFLPTKDGFKNSYSSSSSSEYSSEIDSDETSATSAPPIEAPPGRWYSASDSCVQEVDEKTVLKCEAYLLFYERIY